LRTEGEYQEKFGTIDEGGNFVPAKPGSLG
jgi:hypothetical protein